MKIHIDVNLNLNWIAHLLRILKIHVKFYRRFAICMKSLKCILRIYQHGTVNILRNFLTQQV